MTTPSNIDYEADNQRLFTGRPLVMVVDDDPIIGCVLAGALNRGGFDVEVYNNPIEALEAFDRLEVSLVVVDWIMPGLDGLSLVDALRDKVHNLPAMLITSYGGHEAVRQARSAGRVDAVLTKPFDLRSFLKTVTSFLTRQARGEWEADRPAPSRNGSWGYVDEPVRTRSVDSWQALSGRESYFEQILESVIDAVIMVDKTGRIIYYNRGARRMFGFREAAAADLHLTEVCPDDSSLPSTLAQYFKPHPPVEEQSEAFFRRASGERFYTVFSISLFDPDYQEPAALLVIKDINDRHIMEQRVTEKTRNLEILAVTDPLTGIFNRRHFDRRLEEEYRRVERYNSHLTLIMIDFDHFKLINDLFGHLTGDKVLNLAATEMTRALRDVDILARWGGEEFMALLPETPAGTGLKVARRLHYLIGNSPHWKELSPELKVTVSMGLVSLPWTRQASIDQTVKVLDRALYRAKDAGRDCIVRYLDETDEFEIV